MNANAYVDDTFDAVVNKRITRAVAGLGAISVVLAGFARGPMLIFALSTISVYLTVTAIIGDGIFALFGRLLDKLVDEEDDAMEFNLNVGGGDRVARATVAAVVFTAIINGITMALDPVDYFLWTLVGFYTGMTAILAWDPAYQAILYSTRRRRAVIHAAPQPDRLIVSTVGKVADSSGTKTPRAA